jgi:hypothetical protein
VWLGVRAVVLGHAWANRIAIALTCFMLVLIRNTNIILIAALALAYLGWQRRRQGAAFIASLRGIAGAILGAGIAAALQLAINWYYNGHPVLSSYGSEEFLWHRPMQWSVLFSYERGLFSYYPVTALVLAAAWLVRPARLPAAWFTLVLLAYATLYGFWCHWTLGGGFGHRGFVELMPPAIVLFAAALRDMSPRWRTVVYQGTLVATIVTLQFMVEYWQGSLPCMGTTGDRYWRYCVRGLCVSALVLAAIKFFPWFLSHTPRIGGLSRQLRLPRGSSEGGDGMLFGHKLASRCRLGNRP